MQVRLAYISDVVATYTAYERGIDWEFSRMIPEVIEKCYMAEYKRNADKHQFGVWLVAKAQKNPPPTFMPPAPKAWPKPWPKPWSSQSSSSSEWR